MRKLLFFLCLGACWGVVLGKTGEFPFVQAADYSRPAPLVVSEKQKRAFQLASNLLSKHHYRRQVLDDISSSVIDDYLRALDYSHMYFLQSDVDSFSRYRDTLEHATRNGDLSAAMTIYKCYRERARALGEWSLERLGQPFDLSGEDVIVVPDYLDREEKIPWKKTLDEVHAYQERRLQDALIGLMMTGRTQKKALAVLTKRYESRIKRLNQMTSDDAFDVYMNVIAANFDPHSNYLSLRHTEDFDINMRLSLEGIGATLGYEEEQIVIRELVPGGPAYKSGKLHIKDSIIGVAQGKDGEMQDVVGMRLDKAVRLIRGKKGSYVRLLIEPVNAAEGVREITLRRDEVKLEEQAAHSYLETVEHSGKTEKIGVIRLPSFYMDFAAARKGKKDYRSTSRDVAVLLEKLEKENVSGIVLDLRGDGGGSLYEAIQTVGLFIDKGPVVMVSRRDSEVRVEKDEVAGVLYNGPLAVLIDHNSASASEIFAAAIQDYRRGIIIGTNSYGKGTVQTLIDLNRFAAKTTPPLGEVKFTIAMFHRVTGGSTQKKGVTPDIALPAVQTSDKVGERRQLHALPWKRIPSAEHVPSEHLPYRQVSEAEIDKLQRLHRARMNALPALERYEDYLERVAQENKRRIWSLNLETRKAHYDAWKSYSDRYKQLQQDEIPPLQADKKRKADIERRNAVAETEEDKESFVPDVGLYEALNILYDHLQSRPLIAADKAA